MVIQANHTTAEKTSIKKENRIGIKESEWSTYYEENILLARRVAHNFRNTPYEHEELFSVANIGFVKALQTFDSSKNVKFITYAYHLMHREILRFLHQQKRVVGMLLSETEGDHVKNEFKESRTLEESLYNIERPTNLPLKALEEREFIDIMENYISFLSEKEQQIIIHRYGLCGEEPKTRTEVGRIVGLLQSTISKTEKFALEKLKEIILSRKELGELDFYENM